MNYLRGACGTILALTGLAVECLGWLLYQAGCFIEVAGIKMYERYRLTASNIPEKLQ